MPQATNDLAEIERTAVDLATLGGARIGAALGGACSRFATVFMGEAGRTFSRPGVRMSDQREVEALIRSRVAERFFRPHDVTWRGERGTAPVTRRGTSSGRWDPIDGTTNFRERISPLRLVPSGSLARATACRRCLVFHERTPLSRRCLPHAQGRRQVILPVRGSTSSARCAIPQFAGRSRGTGIPRGGGSALGHAPGPALRRSECAFVAAGLLDVARRSTRPMSGTLRAGLP